MEEKALPADAIRASAGDVELAEQYAAGSIDRESADRWRITTKGSAAWAMARYREAQALLTGLGQQAKEWHDDVDAWYRSSAAPLERTLDYFGENLRIYALTLREEQGVKTVSLPGGRVETRSPGRPRISVDNRDEFTAWVEKNQPEAIKTTVEAQISRLVYEVRRDEGAVFGQLYDPETGERIPGVHAEWAETSAEVRT
jgi:hypothetical protein